VRWKRNAHKDRGIRNRGGEPERKKEKKERTDDALEKNGIEPRQLPSSRKNRGQDIEQGGRRCLRIWLKRSNGKSPSIEGLSGRKT